ncbi:cellulose synthase complex periplasmic endoglucanase BcsZ [Stutzerimonas stutzeri]|uniref:cellulose synthase complex periplasmic endoglucanase BcsZ n=1 Tax=Stutzerimonas stutzeri TaxID=316 RepID=UPI0037179E5E
MIAPGYLALAALAIVLPAALPAKADECPARWPLWEQFAERWVQVDGRVLESSLEPNHSTSEGQSYALFFALVANDRERFEQIWRWSVENLTGNDLDHQLPAWLWGKGKDGVWQRQDINAASDADLWFAFALLEAARLWDQPDYRADAQRLLSNVIAKETARLPGFGTMLLPGPVGFVHSAERLWRLNPSYQPLPVLRRLAAEQPAGPWAEIAANNTRLLPRTAPHGFAPDWVGYRATEADIGTFETDPYKGGAGSYDAIRTYLWAGMTAIDDPLAAATLRALHGMSSATAARGIPPERVIVDSGKVQGDGPFGFSAALVPYFRARGESRLAERQAHRARQGLDEALRAPPTGAPPAYYNYMLSLFGLGWADGYYRFAANGDLQPFWNTACSDITR